MAQAEETAPRSPVTARAVCLGLFFVAVINLVIGYNDWYLYNTLLIGNHFPYIALAITLGLLFVGNGAFRRLTGFEGFSRAELILVWAMIGVGGGIASAGFMRYFPSWMVAPAYYTSPTNEWREFVLRYIPDWMVVSKDPNSDAVKWFMEGLPQGQGIPWGKWIVPMATWFAFMALLYASNFALVSLFFHQWSARERLIFPAVHVPVMLAEEPAKGSRLNAFLSNPMVWVGVAIPCVIWGWNGLRSYVVGMPQIPMSWYYWSIFPDRPWSEFHPENVQIYFTVIGLTFLLTTEIAFSLWFFYLVYRLSFVYVAWLGSGATGFWGNWSTRITVYETAGAMLVIAFFLFWAARRGLKEWLGRVASGKRDAEMDPMGPRLTMALIVAGLAGMLLWYLAAGAQWWAALIGVAIFIVVLLVLTRVIAEAGLIFVQSNVLPYDFVAGLVPAGWISGFSLNALVMQKGILFDLREIFMPYVMNGLKAASQVRMHLGKVMGVFALTAAVGMGIAAYGKISTTYKYGGVNLDQGANRGFPTGFIGNVAAIQKNPPSYERIRIGEKETVPVNVAHLVVGGALTAGMLVMRAKFLWWPLHPFGLVMCGAWAMTMFWFSILIGWILKATIMTFGGAQAYRKALPLFLGLVVGESLIAAFWAILGLITGTRGIYILPY